MRDAEPFDSLKITKYTVVRVHIDLPYDDDESKLFVVLNHVSSGPTPFCNCLKITSHTGIYEASPEMLASCVLFQAGELPFLPKKSAVQPDNYFPIGHAHFEMYAKKHLFRIEGKMPDGFHQKLVAAIKASKILSPKKKKEMLAMIGEGMS